MERRCGVWCVQYLRYLIVALYFWWLHYCCHKFGISNWFKHSRPSIIVIYKIVDRLVLLWKNLNWMHHMYCFKKPRLAGSITIEIRVYDCISVRSFFKIKLTYTRYMASWCNSCLHIQNLYRQLGWIYGLDKMLL